MCAGTGRVEFIVSPVAALDLVAPPSAQVDRARCLNESFCTGGLAQRSRVPGCRPLCSRPRTPRFVRDCGA
jgi:hypothetical protein